MDNAPLINSNIIAQEERFEKEKSEATKLSQKSKNVERSGFAVTEQRRVDGAPPHKPGEPHDKFLDRGERESAPNE